MARKLLTEAAANSMARKHVDVRFNSRDMQTLCEAYNDVHISKSLVSQYGLNQYDKMAVLLVSESSGVSPKDLLLQEGFFDSIKKLGKGIGAAIASPFKAVAKAKKGRDQGASAWQSVKYGMTALPQLFKHGTHFGQGKATEKANSAYQKILSDFENHSDKRLKELTAAAKKLGDDFPNNAKPESFRMMLMGKEKFADVESEGLGGLMGAMLDIRQSQQDFVNNGGEIKVANQIIGRMRKMLQFYMGSLHDTYQSLESKNRYGRPLVRNSTAVALMDLYYDSDYWFNQVSEGMFDTNGILLEVQVADEQKLVQDPEDQKALEAAVDGKSEKEIAQALMNDEGLEGLSDKQLKNMQMASGVLRPLLIGCLGAAVAALGIDMGGNSLGNFEESQAIKDMIASLEGERVGTIIKEVPGKVAEYFNVVDVQPGEGVTQVFGRIGGFTDAQVQNMSMGDFCANMKELGMNPETMEGLMADPEKGFDFLKSANPDVKVGSFLKGVVEIQNAELGGVNAEGHKLIQQMFDMKGVEFSKVIQDTETVSMSDDQFTKAAAIVQAHFQGKIGAGVNPLSLSKGVGPKITKLAAKAATKHVIKYTAKTYAGGKIGSLIGGAALPTVIATAGVGIAASSVAIAALRKFAKNRKKTIQAAIDLLSDIEGPIVGSPATDPNNVGPDSPIEEPEGGMEVQGIADELPLDLFKRSLKDKGYEKEDELADAMFQDPNLIKSLVQDVPPKPQSLTAGYRRELNAMTETINRWNHLAGLNEDLSYDDFSGMTKQVAKDAGLPEPSEDQLGFGAQALNVTRGIGDVNNLPNEFAKEEFENKIDELEKLIGSLKLENNEAVRGMLDTLAAKVGLDPTNYKDLENDEYMSKLGETWNNDQAAWEDAMEEVEGLKMQLAAANQGLDQAEAKIVEQSAQLDKYIEENGHLIAKNKRAKNALRRALDLAKRKDIKIGDLKTGLSQAEDLNDLKDKEIDELQGELGNALAEITALKDREEKLNSRLIDLRKLYLAISKVGGSNKTTYDTKHPAKKRDKNLKNMADAFLGLGDEFPALKDTGQIIQRSIESGVNTAVAGSGQLKKDGGRNEPEARSKKEESSWKKGDLIMEKLNKL